jgi:hypothetical protein
MSRYARRTDAPHSAIVCALRRLGCSVVDLSRVGGGVPDLLVWRRDRLMGQFSVGQCWLVEVKDGKAGKLTAGQSKFMADWPGPSTVIYSLDDAIAWATGAQRPPQPVHTARRKVA